MLVGFHRHILRSLQASTHHFIVMFYVAAVSIQRAIRIKCDQPQAFGG